MRFLVYGVTAEGCYLAAWLAGGGHDVTLLGEASAVQQISGRGVTLRSGRDDRTFSSIRLRADPDTALQENRYDRLIFAMKPYDTLAAMQALSASLPAPPPIVSFQNGFGNEDTLRPAFGEENVVAGVVTSQVAMPEPGVVVETARHGIAVALDTPPAEDIATTFRAAGLPSATVPHSDALKWSKLLADLPGQGSAAILDMHPADALADPRVFDVEWAALREALALLKMRNIELVNLPGAPARGLGWLARQMPRPFLRPLLIARSRRRYAGGMLPPLLAALRAGERRTEAAWLHGAVVFLAHSQERLAPVNHALALTISDIAAGRTSWEIYRHRPDMLLAAVRIAQGMS
jgi:2-dehydropantoate 2-reductase